MQERGKMGIQKEVVEEVSGWLRVYKDGSVDRTWTGPPEVEFLATPVPPSSKFVDGVATHDVFIDPNCSLSVRLYIPEKRSDDDDDGKLPVVLHFHGGGFCISRASWYMYHQFYTRLVKSAQAVCISVDMRLAPEHRLPAAIDDGYSALLWLRSLARGELYEPWLEGADFSRVILLGDSSGGNVVHAVAARAGTEKWSPLRLAGAVPIHPGFVREKKSRSELELEASPFLTLDMVDKFLALALPLGSTKDHPFTCPMGPQAPSLNELKLPPFLVAVAGNDLIRDTNFEYIEAMKKAGHDIEVVISPGMGHSFYLNKIAVDVDQNTATQTELLIGAISNFVKNH